MGDVKSASPGSPQQFQAHSKIDDQMSPASWDGFQNPLSRLLHCTDDPQGAAHRFLEC